MVSRNFAEQCPRCWITWNQHFHCNLNTQSTVWKNKTICVSRQIFREINLYKIVDFTEVLIKNSAIWKNGKFSLSSHLCIWQKFRESNVFTKEKNTKDLIWRNFLWVNFFYFSTLCDVAENSWKQRFYIYLIKKLLKSWFLTKCFPVFLVFPQCDVQKFAHTFWQKSKSNNFTKCSNNYSFY